MNLLERIDLALQHARKSRSDLASNIGITTQAISNLKRRPGSTLRPENVAKAARFMKCDLYWLCTGEPNRYCAEDSDGSFSVLALEVAQWLDDMPEDDRRRVFALLYELRKANWVCRSDKRNGKSAPAN